MQIKKIVSGGQTGADRAALDFAIEYGFEHGGWVPRGRRAEDGVVPARYNLRELADGGYPERTERNVFDSDATLIVSHGELAGGSKLTGELAKSYAKPCLHIDLFKQIAFDAAIDIYEWVAAHEIEILNVAGPRASKDPEIYQSTYNLLETAFHIDIISNAIPDLMQQPKTSKNRSEIPGVQPQTVDAAVDLLMKGLPAIDKMRIASKSEGGLAGLKASWEVRLRQQFGLQMGNKRLLEDCRKIAGNFELDANEAAMMILEAFRKKLRTSGHLRVIK